MVVMMVVVVVEGRQVVLVQPGIRAGLRHGTCRWFRLHVGRTNQIHVRQQACMASKAQVPFLAINLQLRFL